jgi:hypothetical protein
MENNFDQINNIEPKNIINETILEQSKQINSIEKTNQINKDDSIQLTEQINKDDSIQLTEQINKDDGIQLTEQINKDDSIQLPEQINKDNSIQLIEQINKDDSIQLIEQINKDDSIQLPEQINKDDSIQLTEQINKDDSIQLIEQINKDDSIQLTEQINNCNIEIDQSNILVEDNIEMPYEYIKPIYVHSSIEILNENNFRSMKASENIKTGELLIIEHVYGGSTGNCHLILEQNKYLFNGYHPRISSHSKTTDRAKHAVKKLFLNCYGYDDNNKIITDNLRLMNHSCDPNCTVYIQEKYKTNDTHTLFMELYAVRPIKKGEEITSSYGPETSHNRDFECKCGKELPERNKIFNIIVALGGIFSDQNNNRIRKIICEYLDTPESKKILLNHYLVTKGIYMNGGTIVAYTKEGLKLINDIIHKYLGIKNEIKSPDGKIVEQSMNQYKIDFIICHQI